MSVRNIKEKTSPSNKKLNMRFRPASEKCRPVVQSATYLAPLWHKRDTTTTKTTRKEYGFFVNMPVKMQTFSSLITVFSLPIQHVKSVSCAHVVGEKHKKLSSLTSYIYVFSHIYWSASLHIRLHVSSWITSFYYFSKVLFFI
jgi:hypothetical protein